MCKRSVSFSKKGSTAKALPSLIRMADISNLVDFVKCCQLIDSKVKGDFASCVQYTGFDPVAMRKKLMAVKDFDLLDMSKCSFLFLSKGTNLTKMKERMPSEGAKELDRLIRKYSILSTVKNAGPSAVSLSRISSAFPEVILANFQTYNEDQMPRPVKVSDFEQYSSVPFPRLFCCNEIASLLPSAACESLTMEDIDTCLKLITCYLALQTRLINTSMSRKTLAELYRISSPYVSAAHMSKIFSHDNRRKIIIEGGFAPVISVKGDLDPRLSSLLNDLLEKFEI